jgi:hypothetical protein
MIAIATNGSIQGSFPQMASMDQNPAFSIITLALSEERTAVICGGPGMRRPGRGKGKDAKMRHDPVLPFPPAPNPGKDQY